MSQHSSSESGSLPEIHLEPLDAEEQKIQQVHATTTPSPETPEDEEGSQLVNIFQTQQALEAQNQLEQMQIVEDVQQQEQQIGNIPQNILQAPAVLPFGALERGRARQAILDLTNTAPNQENIEQLLQNIEEQQSNEMVMALFNRVYPDDEFSQEHYQALRNNLVTQIQAAQPAQQNDNSICLIL